MEAKYLSTPARSSTSQSSYMVYPRSGTSSSSTIPLPLSAKVFSVLPEVSTGCSVAAFSRHFLKPAPASELGHFLVVDASTSPAAGSLAADDAADPLPTPSPNFILPRLNIFAQQKFYLIGRKHRYRAVHHPRGPLTAGGLQVQTRSQTIGATHEERDSEQDECEVGYSPRVEEASSGAPTGKKSHKERHTTAETRLDVLEASLEELY
ncbi:hypothetical protein B296_00021520 [Ensete ventricosum]|uniref:Uncharacterized protein n=1 Tax=Ensete ventricosum TaxID=4639 RepID=A0A426Y2I6_ENSVE|nr:hypothetical protein B296_00021520 [Ensete ventricosum]